MNNVQEQDQFQMLTQLRKELRITRIFCGISSILTLVLLIGGFFVATKVRDYAAEITPVVQKLSKLDVDEFNLTMENVNASLQAIDWEQVAASLESLDVEAINAAIDELDTAELTEALKNLNEASDTMKSFGDKWKSFTSMFGG